MMRGLNFILTIIFGISVLGFWFLTREVWRVNDANLESLARSGRQFAQSIRQLGLRIDSLEKEKQRLTEELGIREKLAAAQDLFIGVQGRVSEERAAQVSGLKNELNHAEDTILRLKKLGGEPLPKDFINKLLQATARVRCFVSGDSEVWNYKAGSGSVIGRYAAVGGEMVVVTNAHVLEPSAITGKPECEVIFADGARYASEMVKRVFENRMDFAFLRLPEVETAGVELVSYEGMGVGFCEFHDVEIGDRVTILSYPAFSGPERVVSEGEVVNFLHGPIYETTAQIELGSSGGVALLNKKKCVLGMPTWRGIADNFGYSYIQSWPMMLQYK